MFSFGKKSPAAVEAAVSTHVFSNGVGGRKVPVPVLVVRCLL